MTGNMMELGMTVEVMGCPTTCLHCWAVGRSYQAMALEEVRWVLQEVRRFCSAHDLSLGGYPMHEVAAHPQAAQVIRLFHEQWQVEFEPLPTTGVPLATRSDWREFLETLGAVGSTTLWFAFHGADSVHDRMVMRQGAYRESLHAVELTRAFGMNTGCNLFLTKENVGHFDRLIADLQHAGMQEIIPEVSGFTPNARGRWCEALRPEWQEVQPLEGIIDAIPEMCLWRPRWHENLQTEAWYVHQAQIGSWPAMPQRRSIELVCRPNLDVYRGLAGQYTRHYGNLRRDGVDWVLSRAVADGAWSYDELWFTPEQLLPVRDLATRFGDAAGSHVHFGFDSIRYWWLDCARRADRVS